MLRWSIHCMTLGRIIYFIKPQFIFSHWGYFVNYFSSSVIVFFFYSDYLRAILHVKMILKYVYMTDMMVFQSTQLLLFFTCRAIWWLPSGLFFLFANSKVPLIMSSLLKAIDMRLADVYKFHISTDKDQIIFKQNLIFYRFIDIYIL